MSWIRREQIHNELDAIRIRGDIIVPLRNRLNERIERLEAARAILEVYITQATEIADSVQNTHAETPQQYFSGSRRMDLEFGLIDMAEGIRAERSGNGMNHSHQNNLERVDARISNTITERDDLNREITQLLNDTTRLQNELSTLSW